MPMVWALSLSLAATEEIDFLSFPEGTEMFQFPSSRPFRLCIQRNVLEITFQQVAPFGDRGITACLQLPRAYRSLPRPSSPSSAQSSTRCS